MSKACKQKNLGYKRDKTSAMMRVTFTNGEVFDVPLQAIADNRDENYADEKEDTVKYVRRESLSRGEFADWFSNNMNWKDVSDFAIKIPKDAVGFDYEGDFCNCAKDIDGEV